MRWIIITSSCHELFSAIFALSCWLKFVQAQPFDDCAIADFYTDLVTVRGEDRSAWQRMDITALVQTKHRNSLAHWDDTLDDGNFALSATNDDVYLALMELYAGRSIANTIHLSYVDADIPNIPYGPRSWQPDSLWPRERGVGMTGPDATDLFHLMPADSSVLRTSRLDKYFGDCFMFIPEGEQDGTLSAEQCVRPRQAPQETCSCPTIFQPPLDVRGDIARSLLYMELRYDGTEENTENLIVTDCPSDEFNMAYLSVLLQWHEDDPVDRFERERNTKICSDYQGNRNPLVDYPDLVAQYFGLPESLGEFQESQSTFYYEYCENVPTNAPTPRPNICQSRFKPGDLYFYLLNTDNPDSVGIVTLVDLPAGLDLYLTDNDWNGQSLESDEGTIRFRIPGGGLNAGSNFGYGEGMTYGSSWEVVDGSFQLNANSGEDLFLYCLDSSNQPHFLVVISTTTGAQDTDGDESASGLSFGGLLPETLFPTGVILLDHYDNYMYTGIYSGTNTELQQAMTNPANWRGSNTQRFSIRALVPESASPNLLSFLVVGMAMMITLLGLLLL